MQVASGGMLIAVLEARGACKGEPDVIERIKKAMRKCKGHWMEVDESNQFKSAIVAAVLESEGQEKDRIERSSRQLGRLSAVMTALQAGVPVDLEAMAAEKMDDDIIPLMALWHEIKA